MLLATLMMMISVFHVLWVWQPLKFVVFMFWLLALLYVDLLCNEPATDVCGTYLAMALCAMWFNTLIMKCYYEYYM